MSNTYKCPKCGQETLQVTENHNKIGGVCSNCNYKFVKDKQSKSLVILKLLKEYSFIIAIVAIVIVAISFSGFSSEDAKLNTRIKNLKSDIEEDIGAINVKLNGLDSDISAHGTLINGLTNRLENAESNLTALKNLHSDTRNILLQLNDTVNSISKNDIIDNTKVFFNITNYEDQNISNSNYYANAELNIISEETISLLEFYLTYPNSNISIVDEKVINETYSQTLNSYDTINLFKIGEFKNFNINFNITWNSTLYDSTLISHAEIVPVLKLNATYFNDIKFEVKTV